MVEMSFIEARELEEALMDRLAKAEKEMNSPMASRSADYADAWEKSFNTVAGLLFKLGNSEMFKSVPPREKKK